MIIADIIKRTTLEQRHDTVRAMHKPRSLKRVLSMAKRALARADAAIDDALAAVPSPRPIACGPNCPYCCHIRLTASPPEVLLVLTHVLETWDEQALSALKQKVKNVDGLTRGLDDEARARLRLPCPLLKDGSCAIHAVRPLSCRAFASVNVTACKAAYASRMASGVPTYEPQYQVANAVGYGLYAGLADAGFGVENIELTAALAVGLSDTDQGRNIAKAWLKGENPFGGL